MNILEQILRDIPLITRMIFCIVILLSFLTYLEILDNYQLYFNLELIISKFQFWRVITSILYIGQLDLLFVLRIHMLYTFLSGLESNTFKGNSQNFLYFIVVVFTSLLVFAAITGALTLSDGFITILTYYWGKQNSEQMLQILGLFPIFAPYVTWLFVLISLISNQLVLTEIAGIFIGHTFYFLNEVYPNLIYSRKSNICEPPQIFKALCNKIGIPDRS